MKRLAPTPAAVKATVESVPLLRMGAVSEIADAAMFLSSEEAAYVSGVVLPVDGGWSLSGAGALSTAMVKGQV